MIRSSEVQGRVRVFGSAPYSVAPVVPDAGRSGVLHPLAPGRTSGTNSGVPSIRVVLLTMSDNVRHAPQLMAGAR